MLKKVIIGILCFVILAATAGGIYLYTLDWNKHKAVGTALLANYGIKSRY